MYDTLEEKIIAAFRLHVFPQYLHKIVCDHHYGWAQNLRSDADKLHKYLWRDRPFWRVTGAVAGAILLLLLLTAFALTLPSAGTQLYQNDPILIILGHLLNGLMGALCGISVAEKITDRPREFQKNIRHLGIFLEKFQEVCEVSFTDLLRMSHADIKRKADEILIRLALDLRRFEEANPITNTIPSADYDESRARYMRKFEERFDTLKKWDLIHTDKQGGYGWHFAEAGKRLEAELIAANEKKGQVA